MFFIISHLWVFDDSTYMITFQPFGTQYASLAIEIKDIDLSTLLMDISRLYTTGKKNISENYNEVRGYDGTAEATIVYKLESDNALLQKEYASHRPNGHLRL